MELTIEKLVYGGDGLARLPADERGPGKAVFLPFVLAGERVSASIVEGRPGFARARSEAILAPSPARVQPGCPYFMRCGGCHYQHASYEHQLEIKSQILRENLRRLAKTELDTDVVVHPSPPWQYRNRSRMRVRVINHPTARTIDVQQAPRTEDDFAIGYFAFGSHELLPVRQCPISSPLINRALNAVWDLGEAGKVPDAVREAQFFAAADDSSLLIELHAAEGRKRVWRALAENLMGLLPEVQGVVVLEEAATPAADDTGDLRPQHVRAGSRMLAFGASELNYATRSATYRVSAGAFFQTNRFLVDELVEIVCAGAQGTTALDLYAGTGLFSVALARSFRQVVAVEASPYSHRDLEHNAPANVRALAATTEQFLKNAELHPDLVVLDPPRAGLGERGARDLARMGAPRITYVSCDPATLARDLRVLGESGYRIERCHLVDLFPQTFHVESVLQLVR
ncbi:MAG TPA: 23S rRNA (uracil(1939)-C(5))-methyltransferase RlmD [Chloroflexota bacterium]|nr:23S rRNA (uracil(1939)-C(5))-methyltransferase RlmD [Chloroflexota bacterium]